MYRIIAGVAALLFSVSAFAADAPPKTPVADTGRPFIYVPKSSDVIIGKDSAPVTIVEYASLSCPHCGHFYTETLPKIEEKYINTGKAKLVYRDYPLNGSALAGAMLVQCADRDRRHDFVKVLFKTQARWAYGQDFRGSLANIALLGGLSRQKFDSCMNDGALKKQVLDVTQEAGDEYRIHSTPTFFVGGQRQEGDQGVDALGKLIDDALAKNVKK